MTTRVGNRSTGLVDDEYQQSGGRTESYSDKAKVIGTVKRSDCETPRCVSSPFYISIFVGLNFTQDYVSGALSRLVILDSSAMVCESSKTLGGGNPRDQGDFFPRFLATRH